MTIEEKRTKLYDMCIHNICCTGCKIGQYCGMYGESYPPYHEYFDKISEADVNRWFEMVFGEDAEQQEDQEIEDIASAIRNMKQKLIEKASTTLDASKNYSVESEEHRIRMDVVKQACICLEILSRCEKMERKCSNAGN